MKKNLQFIGMISLSLAVLMFLPTLLHAQPIDPGNPDAPLDGGLSLLVAAGVGYGVKKVRENKKRRQEENMEK